MELTKLVAPVRMQLQKKPHGRHQCTSGLTVNFSAKIRDGIITEINSLTQL